MGVSCVEQPAPSNDCAIFTVARTSVELYNLWVEPRMTLTGIGMRWAQSRKRGCSYRISMEPVLCCGACDIRSAVVEIETPHESGSFD